MVNFLGLSRTLKERAGKIKYLGAFTYRITIILTLEKGGYLRQKFHVSVINEYDGSLILKFAIEYLRGNEKVRETVFFCSYGAQVESFKQKMPTIS